MSGAVPLLPKFQFSNNGAPMVNGTVTVYLAGTVTPSNTWQDEALTILNTNPIVLDARGEAVIYLDPALSYKFLLKNSSGVTQWTQDNIRSGEVASLRPDLIASSGASIIGYAPGGAWPATNVQAKLRQYASDATSGPSTASCNAAISVNQTRTTIDRHAFEDWTVINTGAETGKGYASFDTGVSMTNTASQSHLVGYQSRLTYNGSGGLADYMHGYNVSNFHNGTGVVVNHCGINISGLGGTGPVQSDTGLQINAITRGSVANFGIWSGNGNAHYFGGDTGTTRTGVSTALEQIGTNIVKSLGNVECGLGGGFMVNLHYSGGWKYRGNGACVYIGLAGSVLQINTGPVNAAGANATAAPNAKLSINVDTGVVTTASAVIPGSFILSSLPAGVNGAVTYCSNGRKVGEGVGAGTGVLVYYSNAAWRVFSTDAAVTA